MNWMIETVQIFCTNLMAQIEFAKMDWLLIKDLRQTANREAAAIIEGDNVNASTLRSSAIASGY